MPSTYPTTQKTLYQFTRDMWNRDVVWRSTLNPQVIFFAGSEPTNAADLLLIANACVFVDFSTGQYVIKSPYVGTQILSDILVTLHAPTLYLGATARVLPDGTIDANNARLKNLPEPNGSQQAATKNYVDTTVATQTARIDAILDGSTVDLNTFSEIAAAITALGASETADILQKTGVVQQHLDTEAQRALDAEAALALSVTAETGRAKLQETITQDSINTLKAQMNALLYYFFKNTQPNITNFPVPPAKSFFFPDGSHTELYRGVLDVLSTAHIPMTEAIRSALPPASTITDTVTVTDNWLFDSPVLARSQVVFKSYTWLADGSGLKLYFESATQPGYGANFFGESISGKAYVSS